MQSRRDFGIIALVVAFGILAAAVLGTLLLFQSQQRAQAWVIHTLTVQGRLNTVLSRLQDAETGQRGYIITRDVQYLTPYLEGTRLLAGDIEGLRAATADNPAQLARAQELKEFAEARVKRLSVGIELVRKGEYIGASEAIRAGVGKGLMDRAREIIAAMKAEEQRLFDARARAAQRQSMLLTGWLLLSAAAVALLALFVTRDARRRARAAAEARDQLVLVNARLIEEATSREAAEAQVRQMHKMESIGQLTGGIAHDFNNMLAIVIGSLDLAKRRLSKDRARAEACIDNAMQGAERAAQLTSRLLAFSRQQPLAPVAIDANRLVGGMSELLRRTIGETVRFETVLAGGLWPAFIDAGQLENALVNLCVNARDAMPEGGRLTIETSNTHLDEAYAAEHNEVSAGQYVMVSVTDTGFGMPAEVIERAFDPFYTTKEVGSGTGLGLSQVYGFVKQSGGHVKIYSEPGVGTTVKLYVPRHFGVAEVPSAAADNAELPRANGYETVLVVEDDERVRLLSVDSLRELGYTVFHADGPRRALMMIAELPRVDLLFTDVIMPDMNGRKLAEAARLERPDLKVLYTTGYTKNAIVHNGMLDHDVAFLPKPFTIAQLAAKVRQVLDA
ncbi:CHASE3 domain-containing protein [Sphingomonas sp. JC676]|uniref:CHASE3 domain-containing protein n=1 Tax=Sphingomonas sp. JC676 TaxID=2768065 RepID=UPI001657BB72|nr:CHASE3 domain-containing protein [Sphingomonas sp. JC676]MBC9034920.1 CHASE3 domain-containing protein [Sphingomonas sp. JC676]